MGFMVNSLFDIVFQLCKGFMFFFSGSFWKDLMVPEVDSASLGDIASLFTLGSTSLHNAAHGPFDYIFQGLHLKHVIGIIKGLAYMLATLIFLFGLLRALMPDTPNSKAQHPATLTGRFILANLCITCAYGIMNIVQYPMWVACDAIYNFALSGEGQKYGFSAYPAFVTSPAELEDPSKMADVFDDTFNLESVVGMITGYDMVPKLISIILCLVMTYSFVKLVLEIVERYIVCGFLFYMAPMGFSLLASEGTANTTKTYMQMIIGQYLVITMNLMIIFVFFGAVGVGGGGMLIKSASDQILFMCLLISWLRLGAKLDEMMRTLGFSVAQTGAGLGAEIAGTALTIGIMAKTATSAMSAGKNLTGKIQARSENAARQKTLNGISGAQGLGKSAGTTPNVAGRTAKDGTPLASMDASNTKSWNGGRISESTERAIDDRNAANHDPSQWTSGEAGLKAAQELLPPNIADSVESASVGANGAMSLTMEDGSHLDVRAASSDGASELKAAGGYVETGSGGGFVVGSFDGGAANNVYVQNSVGTSQVIQSMEKQGARDVIMRPDGGIRGIVYDKNNNPQSVLTAYSNSMNGDRVRDLRATMPKGSIAERSVTDMSGNKQHWTFTKESFDG